MNELEEIKKNMSKHSEKTEDKKSTEYLVKLNKRVSIPAKIFEFSFCIISALILGVGMCMCLDVISGGMILGCIIEYFGLLIALITYPIYKVILKKSIKSYKKKRNFILR